MADLEAALRPHVDSGEIPGLVALVARGPEVDVVVLGDGMRRDSIVRAASGVCSGEAPRPVTRPSVTATQPPGSSRPASSQVATRAALRTNRSAVGDT